MARYGMGRLRDGRFVIHHLDCDPEERIGWILPPFWYPEACLCVLHILN